MLTLALALALQACPQRILVTAPALRATTATLSLLECGKRVAGPFDARVGVRGLSANRREGDGTTPIGTFGIGPTIYGLDPDPGVRLRYHRLRCGDWWDGDARSPTYNRFRHVPCGTMPPFRGGSALAPDRRLPRIRVYPVQRGAGRAGARLRDLPARRPRPADERLCQLAPPATAPGAEGPAARRPDDDPYCIILVLMYSLQRYALCSDHRHGRLRRPGDT
jgi:hypothetical protein